ncbi:hypothetical protein K8942_02045 [Candidatus Peribacteria bacterium]|nr:MAG: hypothetical protein K8942_02045 [Candidatus Peribacteria bacterium]
MEKQNGTQQKSEIDRTGKGRAEGGRVSSSSQKRNAQGHFAGNRNKRDR